MLGGQPQECSNTADIHVLARCDDGSLLFDSNGNFNRLCQIEGCTMDSDVCWEYRTAHCFDEYGFDNGQCVVEGEACTTVISCAAMYGICPGTFVCADGGIFSAWCECITPEE